MRALLLAVLLTLAAMAQSATAQDRAQVPVRAGLHKDYGRIVFDWPRRVDYEARIEEGRLVVSFGEAAAFEGPLLRGGLDGYTEAPLAAEDGRGLSLPLKGDYGLKHFRRRFRFRHVIACADALEPVEDAEPGQVFLNPGQPRTRRHRQPDS